MVASFVVPVTVVVCATRERARALAKAAFPRRRCRLQITRNAHDLERVFRSTLVDAALVDVAAPNDDTWRAVDLAREFPSAPFFALSPLRPTDGPTIARAAAADVADVVAESIDDAVLREL